MKNLKAKQASLLNENYHYLYFKERLPNEGYSTLVRKFEKRSSLSHASRRVIIVHLHIAVVKILRKSFIATDVTDVVTVKIIFGKNCIPELLMWKFVRDWSALVLDFVFFPLH